MFLPRVDALQARHPAADRAKRIRHGSHHGASSPRYFSINWVGTEATTETISLPVSSQA